eukprot:Platyproteum_vivax@DN2696_c0_g1_i1.p1
MSSFLKTLDTTIGVLGGGQLGRMMIEASYPLNLKIKILDPNPDCSCAQITKDYVKGSFKSAEDIGDFIAQCDVVTYEIEHVNYEAVALHTKKHDIEAHPHPNTIGIIQNKIRQKELLRKFSSDFVSNEGSDTHKVEELVRDLGYPLMLKTARLGYDGKGNKKIVSEKDFQDPEVSKLLKQDYIIEKWVAFECEVACMVVKEKNGKCSVYPLVQTYHVDSVLSVVVIPAQLSPDITTRGCQMAEEVVQKFEGAGVYCVEMFLMEDGSLYVNEVAPRPHNSGHYTIEACYTSQFENHLRAVAGLPIGSCELRNKAIMINVLGARGNSQEDLLTKTLVACEKAFSHPNAHVHWYGKSHVPGRKMGHITLLGDNIQSLLTMGAEIFAETPSVLQTITEVLGFPNPEHCLSSSKPVIGVVMGSDSDLLIMKGAAEIIKSFNVPVLVSIVSAHRTPDRLYSFSKSAKQQGLEVIIAGAGGAAHLPGMVAALCDLPVIGVPIALEHLRGVDSLHSIVQMPAGIPVATVAINNAKNAGLLAIRIISLSRPWLSEQYSKYVKNLEQEVLKKVERLSGVDAWENYQK